MTYETAVLSGDAFELRVCTYGGTIVSRHSSALYGDNRYCFALGAFEVPAECADVLPNGVVVKGHAIDGMYNVLLSDCEHCKRTAGRHIRPGMEVRVWLDQMPEACKKWWQSQGCDGSATIDVGGDDVQGYYIECDGCSECRSLKVET